MMNKRTIEEHLRQAEGHVSLGQRHVMRQQQIVAELERDGHDSRSARELLCTFEELQTMHVSDRDRLITELAEAAGKSH